MIDFLADWLAFLLRWSHVLAGITWIGTSFYFNWFDLSVRETMAPGKKENLRGNLTEVHGGNFYYHEQYWPDSDTKRTLHHGGPAQLTLLTGLALMALVYWVGARSYLIDTRVLDLTPEQAILISMASFVAGWLVYDQLVKRIKSESVLVALLVVGTAAASYGFLHVFSPRAAYLHVGAVLGTIMVMNVIRVIIPGHIGMRRQLQEGEALDRSLGAKAKRRSQHNNYLTLPVLFSMIGIHFSAGYGHPYAWAVLPVVMLAGVALRHYRNIELVEERRHYGYLGGAIALFAVAVAITAYRPQNPLPEIAEGSGVNGEQVLAIVTTHCTNCHAAEPIDPDFAAPPGGLLLVTLDDIKQKADLVYRMTVVDGVMPLGNKTEMTDEERAQLGAWLKGATSD